MDKKQTHIMNHFIQKALAKNFAVKGKISWVRYGTNEEGVFHIKSSNHKQPIAKKEFYSEEIELGMNVLECDGIKVLTKVALEANSLDEISLSRRELVCLKFYSLLTSARTDKLRNNISNLTGDSLFNKTIKQDGRDAKTIQEEKISIILKEYQKNRKKYVGISEEEIYKDIDLKSCVSDNIGISKKNLMHELQNNLTNSKKTLISISNIINSRLLIFKFESPKLFLTESQNFTESRPSGGIAYNFMPIAPNVGIGFYFDPVIARGTIEPYKSRVFENDIHRIRPKNVYVNIKKIEEEKIKFIQSSNAHSKEEMDRLCMLFASKELYKYYDEKDQYIYKVLNEKNEIADLCNAMAMVHNNKQMLLYQKKEHIQEAEAEIKNKGIYRIEDYQ